MSSVAALVGHLLETPVIDKTGLAGMWSFRLLYDSPGLSPENRPSSDAPSIPIALVEQLGLKLERQNGRVEVLVIESVQQPTEN
jgi:uncharacterized protein (TIGR03435 family)